MKKKLSFFDVDFALIFFHLMDIARKTEVVEGRNYALIFIIIRDEVITSHHSTEMR